MTHDAAISAFFDQQVLDGSALAQEQLLGDLARQVLDAMAVAAGQQMIDIGCGVGWATKRLGKKAPGAQAVGVDLSAGMIATADAETDWTSRARFERMPMEALEFPDGRFDHAFALDSLEYTESAPAALGEIARATKPGGRLELVVRRFQESPATAAWSDAIGVDLPWLSSGEWGELVEESGFSVDSVERLRDARADVPFEPSTLAPDRASHDALVEAGALWIRAVRATS